MIEIKLEHEQVQQVLNKLENRLEDLEPIMEVIGELMFTAAQAA